MTHYVYEGTHYELPEGLSNDDAIGKIKQHLGQNSEQDTTMGGLTDALGAAGRGINAAVEAGVNTGVQAGSYIPAVVGTGLGFANAALTGNLKDFSTQDTFEGISNAATRGLYNASSPLGQEWTDKLGEAFNAVGLPVMGHGAQHFPAMKGAPRGVEEPIPSATDRVAGLAEKGPDVPNETPGPDFWKQRAEQMTAEARANDAQAARFNKINPEQPPVYVGQEGNAIQGDTGKAMLDSTRGVEYEQVPPDGSIPQSGNGMEVPKGNEWSVDENGMPVRQGIPGTEEGTITLYRAESPTNKFNDVFNKNELTDFASLKSGTRFTSDPNYAEYFKKSYGKDAIVRSIEVPKSVAEAGRLNDYEFKINEDSLSPQSIANNTPEVNDLGNAIQEANGPVLSPGESQGVGNLSGPMGAPDFWSPASQRGSAPWINDVAKAAADMVSRMKGRVDSESSKTLPIVVPEPMKNSMATPTEPATIARKQELRSKVEASALLKKLAPEYSDVTTPQETIALAKDAKDSTRNPVRDATISGINGHVMWEKNNPVMNFTRYALQEARNRATSFSKQWVTSNDGAATTLGKLKGKDLIEVTEVLQAAAKAGQEITPENIKRLGLKPHQEAAILSVRKGMGAMWDLAADSLQTNGRDAFKKRSGYLPAMFSGAYKTIVAHNKNGLKVAEVIQADTKWQHDTALKASLAEHPGTIALSQPRRGLSTGARGNDLFNGFNDIMNALSKDPRFADMQLNAQMKVNNAIHKFMGFDVHELEKKGVKGALGERRVSAAQNAKDLRKGIIDYLEQGAEYHSMQTAVNQIGQVLTDPAVAHMKNTIATISQHIKHVTKQDLAPIGAFLNSVLDAPAAFLGVSPKYPLALARGLKTAMGLEMMGFYNPTFFGLQLTQVLTGALPEMAKVTSRLGTSIGTSPITAGTSLGVLSIAKRMKLDTPSFVPEHMKAAFQWAQDHGIMNFSELEQATNATRNKKVVTGEKIAGSPIIAGEALTRPPVFMTFADIFHKIGLSDDEAFRAAQHATNFSMGDYNLAERPSLYSKLGVTGEFAGALTTYKHNALTQDFVRARDTVVPGANGKRLITPAIAALAAGTMFQGITGSPGYDDLDSAYGWATSLMGERKSIREAALQSMPEWNKSGVLSATTGYDFQSRASMSRILPELKGGSVSPQLALLADILVKASDYAKYRDRQSRDAFLMAITPAGMKGITEDALLTDPDGTVRNAAGEQTAPEPRTDKERLIRKTLAVRPLRESIESKDAYNDSLTIRDREEAQKTIATRFRQAFANGDQKGMDSLAQMYYDKEGDPKTLFDSPAIKLQIQRANQSQRERLTGKLSASMKSINRYRDMNDGK